MHAQYSEHDLHRRHLAAAEGCYAVVQWLLHDAGAKPNPIDRFGRTPLEDAVGAPAFLCICGLLHLQGHVRLAAVL